MVDDADVSFALENKVLEQVFRLAPIPLCVLDRQFRYLLINERMAEVNGRPVAEHLGRTVDEIVPTFAEKIKAEVRPVMERGQPEPDHLFSGPIPENPTSTGDWLASYYPLHGEDGSVRGVIVALADVTQLRRIERELRQSEQRLRFHVENTTLAVVEWDAQFVVTHWSDQAERVFGWNSNTITWTPCNATLGCC